MSSANALWPRLRRRLARLIAAPESDTGLIGNNGCLEAAASFIAWNQIEGDYLEFGVWRGQSFAAAWHALNRHRKLVASQEFESTEFRAWCDSPPRFFAFDSFEGLPAGDLERQVDYAPGAYGCSLEEFRKNIVAAGVDWTRVEAVKGFFDDSLTPAARSTIGLRNAALVYIDCDLYESTVPVLEFVTPLLVQGSVIIFDDWFRYRGSPQYGEQRACREWLARNPQIQLTEHWRQGPQTVSFLVNFEHDAAPGGASEIA